MSNDDNVMVKTRRALNCLQHSPNGKSIVGISPRKTTNRKKVVYDSSETNNLKRRTSISLPDICSYSNAKDANNLNKSATSTPHKVKVNTATTPIKFSKTNISIIIEEKENPNYCFANSVVEKSELNNKKETREIAIQCNKSEENMLFSDSVEGTSYWKLIALKRVKALLKSKEENSQIHKDINQLDEKNESLRQKIKDLYELIEEYKEIKKSIMESLEDEDNDSGYDM